ncbi:MAG: radical SAM protein [Deltaproteobacteria bacterium]|nr:radical SAM protein [Deltaproteobacteria bacterium]
MLDLHLASVRRFGPRANDRMIESLMQPRRPRWARLTRPTALLRLMKGELKDALAAGCDVVAANAELAPLCLHALQAAKELAPNLATVVGGHNATAHAKDFAGEPWVDFVVVGEGDLVLRDLVDALACGTPVTQVAGLCLAGDEGPQLTSSPAPVDLSQLGPPARQLLAMAAYGAQNHSVAMLATRGCTGSCTFCGRKLSPGQRRPPVAAVLDELEQVTSVYDGRVVHFYDNTLNASRSFLAELCEGMLARELSLRWTCLARPEGLDDELVRKMARAGCVLISFGLESGAQHLLHGLDKGIDLGGAKEVLACCHRHGIATRATFVYDLPSETLSDLGRTIALLAAAHIDLATFWPLELQPAAPILQTLSGCLVPAPQAYGLPARRRSLGGRLLLQGKHRFFGALNAYYHHKAERLGARLGLAGAAR